jgi:hypothetical protein
MTFKKFITGTCLVMIASFFLPYVDIPFFGIKVSPIQIVGHAKEIGTPFVYSLFVIPIVAIVALICNQKSSTLADILIAFVETIAFLILVIAIGFIIYYSTGSVKITDMFGIGAYLAILCLGILTYDLFANQSKKYEVPTTN